ncbi:MAG: ribose 5-phosphate isomerase B [Clostridia bacterium]|nr:ribose 5-phosphate isomerase B [Clostridia bacterium]MBQ4085407.1 ribose 5-phosphate isomerase B [Clostridia bacterium]
MRVAIGCDHLGYVLKVPLIEYIKELGHEVVDVGCNTTESVDYPIYGEKVGRAVASGDCQLGITLCGTGAGISLAANRVPGIRAVCCSDEYTAEYTRRHNNSNVLSMGMKVVTIDTAKRLTKLFLETEFEGGRHQRRVSMLDDIH